MTRQQGTPRKRLFIALMGLTCVVLVGIILLAWWIPSKGLANIHPDLPRLVGLVVLILSGIAIL
jgi:type II secretory pathway component PulM